MSVFKVHLNNIDQGQLDLNPATATPATMGQGTGSQMQPSIQRTMSVCGPRGIFRNLKDGTTFSDCNYWKRFAYPQVALADAIVEVITDDGSVYSDVSEENTFGLVFGGDTAYTVASTDTFANGNKVIDITGTYGGFAKFVQIQNFGTTTNGTQDIKVKLSGSTSAIFKLVSGDTQVFNANDLAITALAFQGGSASTTIQIILSVKVVCNS